MQKLTDKKQIGLLIRLCTLAYLVSYVTRVNLSATLVEVIAAGMAAKKTAALALTVCSVTYGIGQVLSGWICDRYKPQNLIMTGFLITICTNLGVGFMPGDTWLVPLWAINGVAQAMMWPPMVRILSWYLTEEDYRLACVRVSWGSSVGTILVYLAAPLIIGVMDVRWVFVFCAASACLMLAVWKIFYGRNFGTPQVTAGREKKADRPTAAPLGKTAVLLMAAVFFGIVLQGFLRDGVTNWMPSYVSEVFRLDSSTSILSGVILPVFAIVCLGAASEIQKRFLRNELVCGAVFFAVACGSAVVLAMCSGKYMLLSVLCFAMLVGAMHGVNFMLVGMAPRQFERYGRVGLVSGVLNAGTYVGSAVSTYGTAVFTELHGWEPTALLWAVIALAGVVLGLVFSRGWGRFREETV